MEGPRKRRVDMEAELPMALNQLASVPGSLGTFREALGEAGTWRTCWGGLRIPHRQTHTDSQDRQDKGLGREGRAWESLLM